MKTITQNDFPSLLGSHKKVVVKFSAPWCGPCKALTPMLEKVSGDFLDIQFVEVNVDESPALAAQFNVRSIPTMVGFVNATPEWVKIGLPSGEDLKKTLSSF